MGYSIELYNLDCKDLGRTFASGDAALLQEVRTGQGAVLHFQDDPDFRAEWDARLQDLLIGNSGKVLAAHGCDPKQESAPEVSDAMALAFVAVVRVKGEFIGELRHSSMTGRSFREEFLAKDAPEALGTSVDLFNLMSRPLFGIQHEDYPSWGGLTIEEIREITRNIDMEDPPTTGDSDEDSWLYELCDALCYAREAGKDIVSLYL